ncbi:MAG TPA: BREX system P-loop protein BrxC [Clostridiaceae bacterium]|nr:BREX system P-loop protein BrxC [Clostridiaceae bacterium]
MLIKNMFSKPIDRDIKGVIKVGQDDQVNIQQELEEYVVTNELQVYFSEFFSNYKKSILGKTDNMGVWISGFFGSGKSHFLKILSYLLENKEVNGKKAIDYFEEDNKIMEPIVLADMKLAANVPTDVVLFNIDSKSEVTGKQSKVAIVSVLQNVFNEMLGYCGSNPFLADLERNLSEKGQYDLFKEKFKNSFGSDWIEIRNDFDFIQDDVVEILDEIGFMSLEAARNWCEKATGEYRYKVEDFVRLVKDYLDTKEKNHHIVFLIDEIGQYIGDDSRLMLNLQTVTEDLGTVCKGKAWIIVTSQQDIDSITRIKGNDFSKIQGRFDTRLSLSSANVDEVIKKRILDKTKTGKQTLTLLYDNKATIIKNLIYFNDEVEKKLYSGKENFADVYPFVPYQFNLLGSVLTSIRTHGASGKHLAEGERSMLALFQESAIRIMDNEDGAIVPFNMFYDALEQFLDHSHRGVISRALDNEILNPNEEKENFNVNVLKTLFMIKYVKEIKPNLENITSLMVSDIDEDRMHLTQKVEKALRELTRQSLVQRHGELYVFLTNEEQEINRAIQTQNIETGEVVARVSSLIFEDIYAENRYRHSETNGRYAFNFNQVVDGKPYKAKRNYELTLEILTPDSEESADEKTIRMHSYQSRSVLVVLPDNRAFLDEIISVLKIEKFLRYDSSNAITKYETIREAKRAEINEREGLARTCLEESLQNASIYINGELIISSTKDITSRINQALGKLVEIVYSKLSYMDTPVNESDIRLLFEGEDKQISLDGKKQEKNKLALDEVENYIALNSRNYMKTSLKSILDRFLKAPYGFLEVDVSWIVASLFKDGKIALLINNEVISLVNKSKVEVIRYLTRKEYHEKLMIDKKVQANEKQKKSVRTVMKELYHINLTSDDDDQIMHEFLRNSDDLKNELERLNTFYLDEPGYPGKETIKSGRELLSEVLQITTSDVFFSTIDRKKDEYLDFADDYVPVKNFFTGEQKDIFDKNLKIISIYNDSKNFIVNADIEDTIAQIQAILKNPNPYGQIYRLPSLYEQFNIQYGSLLAEQHKPVKEAIEEAMTRAFNELEGKKCRESLQGEFEKAFDELKKKSDNCHNIAALLNIKLEADILKQRFLNSIHEEEAKLILAEKATESTDNSYKVDISANYDSLPPVKQTKTLSIRSINNDISWQIEDEEDVKKYIAELEKKLIEALEENTILNIEF